MTIISSIKGALKQTLSKREDLKVHSVKGNRLRLRGSHCFLLKLNEQFRRFFEFDECLVTVPIALEHRKSEQFGFTRYHSGC